MASVVLVVSRLRFWGVARVTAIFGLWCLGWCCLRLLWFRFVVVFWFWCSWDWCFAPVAGLRVCSGYASRWRVADDFADLERCWGCVLFLI